MSEKNNKKRTEDSKRKYYPEIDILKAFAAFLVIFIHVIDRYRHNIPSNQIVWDLAHFAVGSFVFASGFLMANSIIRDHSLKGVMRWIWKRIIRVYIPYLMFIPIFVGADMLVNGWSEVSKDFNPTFWINTFTMMSGVGNNWIPRLFLWLSGLYIFAEIIKPYFKHIYDALLIIALIIAGYFLLGESDFMIRDQRIAGWFIIFMAGFMFQRYYKNYKKLTLWTVSVSVLSFLAMLAVLIMQDQSTMIFSNKNNAANLYFVSYNIFAAVVSLSFFKLVLKKIQKKKLVMKVIQFYSHASYDIFFYHLVVMLFFHGFKIGLWQEYIVVTILTTALVLFKRNILKIEI
jgi:peptidoglycan/LPS O-acetylase OafA/YrhL